MSLFSLEGKTALVTGGTRGIGRAIVLALADAGADVAFTYARSKEAAEEIVAAIEAKGRKSKAYQADAADAAQAAEVVQDIGKNFGNFTILVNNAGVTRDTLIMRMSEQQWDEVITTNLKSVFNYSKACTRPFMKQRGGSIINIGSVVGLSGNAGQTNYAASKAGIIGFSKSLAKELASRNVRVNTIAPGYIKTEMTGQLSDKMMESISASIPMAVPGEVDDVAAGVIYLASEASRYVTGETLRIDGGMAM